MYADANGVAPKGIYLTTLAIVILVTRPISGRLGDRFGYRRVFVPCLILIAVGLACLAFGGTRAGWSRRRSSSGSASAPRIRPMSATSCNGVSRQRRGAAFGAILAAFDTGIGTGSTSMGWMISATASRAAFGIAAALVGAGAAVFPARRPSTRRVCRSKR